MKLSVAIQTPEVQRVVPVALLCGTFEGKLAKAAALGYDGVELMTADPAALDAAHVRDAVRDAGLVISAIGSGAVAMTSGLTLLNEDPEKSVRAQACLVELIKFADGVAAPIVTVGSLRGRLGRQGSPSYADLVQIMQRMAEAAAKCNVRLAIEPLNRYESDVINTVEQGLTFIHDVGYPALGLVVDTYHVNIEERSWTSPFRQAMAAECLFHVHLGENNRLSPGSGLIDFPTILSALGASGYQGYLSAELLAWPDGDTAAQRTAAYIRPLLATTGSQLHTPGCR